MIEENEIMNLHDVVSLFTNVPIIEELKLIGRRLNDDVTLAEHAYQTHTGGHYRSVGICLVYYRFHVW